MRLFGWIAVGLAVWGGSAQAQTRQTFVYDIHGRLTAATQAPGTEGGAFSGYAYDASTSRTLRRAEAPGAIAAQDVLASGEQRVLQQGLKSSDNRFRLDVQADGNLTVWFGSSLLWAANTYGSQAMVLKMQSNGNLELQGPASSVLWASGTQGNPGARLVMQTDGNLVIYSGSTPLWSTGTGGH